MTVLDRGALEASPLADLHAIASELSIDGYRRLRKQQLIGAILGEEPAAEPATNGSPDTSQNGDAESGPRSGSARRRGRRGGRGRGLSDGGPREGDDDDRPARAEQRASRSNDDRPSRGERAQRPEPKDEPPVIVEGVVELLPNGSGFVRVAGPEASDDDVYISAAQVKRCELVNGDKVTGPRRAPQRSERFASLVRVDTINGTPATEIADRARFDDLPSEFPTAPFQFGSDADPTLKAIESLTPIGRGSRVTITGATGAGKSFAIGGLAQALSADESLTVLVALTGVRPEELSGWKSGPIEPAAAVTFAASADAQDHAAELVIDQARRIVTRGADAVVLIDSLDLLHPHVARKVLAAARNITDGGSLTVIAASSKPIGGETTVIALDPALTLTGNFPALDLASSVTLRPNLLVGDSGAAAIAKARRQ
jgi:transcription termination factor Rho